MSKYDDPLLEELRQEEIQKEKEQRRRELEEKAERGFKGRPRLYSDEELKEELRALDAELGRPPRLRDMRDHGLHSVDVYKERFGTWVDALLEAGIEPDERQLRKRK